MRGFFADERVESGLWNQHKIIYRWVYHYFKKKENQFLLVADKIVVLTNEARKIIAKTFSVENSKMKVIPCCVDTSQFDPDQIDQQLQVSTKLKLSISKNDFVVSYLGAIGTWYLLDEMLDFFRRLLQVNPHAKFLFITHHSREEIIHSALQKNIPEEKMIIVKAQRNEVPLFLSLSHVSVFFIIQTFSKMASSPTKLAEIFSMGIPVICNTRVGDVEEIIQASGAGLLINQFTNEEFDLAISKIPVLLNKNKSEIRNFCIRSFSLTEGINDYDNIYNRLQ